MVKEDPMQRRTFVKTVIASGGTLLNFFYPGLTHVFAREPLPVSRLSKSRKNDPDYDHDFFGGTVVAVVSHGIVLEHDDEVRAIILSPETNIWKEFDFKYGEIAITVGDYVDARGKGMEDDSLIAENLWINIGRVDGVFQHFANEIVTFTDHHGRQRKIGISKSLDVIHAHDGSPLAKHIHGLSAGHSFGAVGLRLPDGGFRATRIWHQEVQA